MKPGKSGQQGDPRSGLVRSLGAESLLRVLAEHSPDHIVLQDVNLRYVAVVNPQLGLTAEDMLGKTDLEITRLDREASERLMSIKRGVLAGGQPYHFDSALPNAQGESEYFDGVFVPLRDGDGRIEGLAGFFRNVTAQRKAALAVRVLGEQMRTFIQDAPMAVAMFDREMRYLHTSRRWVEDFHLEGREIAGKSHYEIFPDIPEHWRVLHRRCLAGESLASDKDRFERADGSVYWLRWKILPWREEAGAIGGMIIFSEDVTEREQAQQAVRESEERLRTISEHSLDGINLLDLRTGRYMVMNPAQVALTGFTAAELEGMTAEAAYERVHPDDREISVQQQKKVIAGQEKGVAVEYRWKVKSGEYRWFSDSRSVVCDAQGRPVALVGISRDITERKRAEAERAHLEARNQQLQKAESLSRMAGAIAHHFNNRLQAVMLSLDVIESVMPGNKALARSVAETKQGVQRAADVSAQLLAYLGQTGQQLVPSDLATICREGLAAITDSRLELSAALPGPGVVASGVQIGRAVANLVANAQEATAERTGKIRVSVGVTPANALPVENRFPADFQPVGGEYAFVEVADNGSGIVVENIASLFDPFFTTKFTGRGMGLAIVLGIARAHRGAVSVQSEPGRGSVFRLYLPAQAELAPAAPAPAPRGEPMTVLVVDDDELLRAVVRVALESWGYAALEAEDGHRAMEVFAQHRRQIGCVVCDVVMPRMNGWQTLDALRRLDPGLPVIMATGFDDEVVNQQNRAEQPLAFLLKPFELEKLHQVLLAVPQSRANR